MPLPILLVVLLPTLVLSKDISSMFAGRMKPIPAIGSAAWTALYPPASIIPTPQQSWLDALDEAIALKLIPDETVCPVAANSGGWPSYGGLDGASKAICQNALGCHSENDGWDAPDGYFGVSLDDGPLPPGSAIYKFFNDHRIPSSSFLIGSNILKNWEVFLEATKIPQQHFAVHTWTHPYMSALSNEEVVGEIGWTMQIIADNTGGRIPAFWRPPYGDVDNRVRAIAKHVFGLKTVLWNHDSEDWTIGSGAAPDGIQASLQGWVDGPKSPGLIPLEHELSDGAVQVFMNVYPSMVSNGWKLRNIAQIFGLPWYANADDWKSPLRSSDAAPNKVAISSASNSLSPSISSTNNSSITRPKYQPATSQASSALTNESSLSPPPSPTSTPLPSPQSPPQAPSLSPSATPPLPNGRSSPSPAQLMNAATSARPSSVPYRPPQSHQQQGLNQVGRKRSGGCHAYHGEGAGQGEGRTGSFGRSGSIVNQAEKRRVGVVDEREMARREGETGPETDRQPVEQRGLEADSNHFALELLLWPHVEVGP